MINVSEAMFSVAVVCVVGASVAVVSVVGASVAVVCVVGASVAVVCVVGVSDAVVCCVVGASVVVDVVVVNEIIPVSAIRLIFIALEKLSKLAPNVRSWFIHGGLSVHASQFTSPFLGVIHSEELCDM